MEVLGNIRIFVEEKHSKEGQRFKVFNTSVSHKNEDGSFTNFRMKVALDKERFTEEKQANLKVGCCYWVELKKAWLDVRSFKNDDKNARELILYIKDANFTKEEEIKTSSSLDI